MVHKNGQKFFVPLLKLFTPTDYTVKDSFDFSKDISQKNSKLFIASLDVDSFFTYVPLDKTIDKCVKELFKMSRMISGLNKQQVLEMLSLTTKDNILFDEHFYRSNHRFFLKSNFGKHFLCHHKTKW